MKPRCEAEKATERIKENKTLTDKDILAIEVFLRKCIENCSNLNKTLNIFVIRKKRDEDAISDPTTQETLDDKPPKKRWWWF